MGHPNVPVHARYLAAVMAGGAEATLSHRSAAALAALRKPTKGPVDITIPGTGHMHRTGLRIHTTRHLPPQDVTLDAGVRTTTPARTIVDLAAELRPAATEQMLATAYRLGITSPGHVRECLERLPANRKGHGVIRDLLTAAPSFSRSQLERRFLDEVRAHGLPEPLANQQVGPYEVDFLWPDHHLAVELDTYATHGDRIAFHRDRRKDAYLQARGVRVVRLTEAHVPPVLRRLLAGGEKLVAGT